MEQPRVLVVDDERFFREAITDVLDAHGIAFSLATTGAEALEQVPDESLGAVILDLQLPDIHGLEVFRRLREQRPELRVVILSAHTDQQFVLEALRLGAFDYLAKPLHEEELALAVRRALDTYGLAAGLRGLRARLEGLAPALASLWERSRQEALAADPGALAEATVQAASQVLGAARTSLLLWDEASGALRVAAARGFKEPLQEVSPPAMGEGVAGTVLARGEALLVPDVEADPRFAGRAPAGRYASRSFAVVPLASDGRTRGVLCATEREGGLPFGEEDLAILRILAEQTVRAWEAARDRGAPVDPAEAQSDLAPVELAGEAEGSAELVAELARAICEAVTAEVEPARVLEAALRPVARALGAAPVSLYLADPDGSGLRREAECDGGSRGDRERLPRQRGLLASVLEGGHLVASPQPASDPRFDPEVDTPEDGSVLPLLCGPLRFRGRTLGVFRAFPSRESAAAPEIGEMLAAALSVALRSALLSRSLVEAVEEVAEARRGAAR